MTPNSGLINTAVIPEIDIWRAASLMLKRYGDKAEQQSAARADELAAPGRSQWRSDLAPDHACSYPARKPGAAERGPLIPENFVPQPD